jgi:translation initiation factor IF-3
MRLHAELKKSKDLPMINEEITSPVVRLLLPKDGESLGEDEMIGIVPIERALQEARIRELDLVLINEKSDPPVCKVIDFGKYKYTIEKRKKDNLKKQNKVETKEIKMSASIEQHDFDVRSRALQKFIADGYRVRVLVRFKGREMQHTDNGRQLLLRLYQPFQDTAVMEGAPNLEGRTMIMTLSPKKSR